MTLLRQFTTLTKLPKEVLKEALESGPKFTDFISGEGSVAVASAVSVSQPRLPKWLKTPIPVGERYFHLKETLRDLKLHTVKTIKL